MTEYERVMNQAAAAVVAMEPVTAKEIRHAMLAEVTRATRNYSRGHIRNDALHCFAVVRRGNVWVDNFVRPTVAQNNAIQARRKRDAETRRRARAEDKARWW